MSILLQRTADGATIGQALIMSTLLICALGWLIHSIQQELCKKTVIVCDERTRNEILKAVRGNGRTERVNRHSA